jgi:hypothetical protein
MRVAQNKSAPQSPSAESAFGAAIHGPASPICY